MPPFAFALLGFALPARAAHPADAAPHVILDEMAARRPDRAARLLRAELARGPGAAAEADLRCLLGHALLQDGRPAEALAAVTPVPAEAPCGPRAAFTAADALLALGRADEAAARIAAAGAPRLGPDRDLPGLLQIERLIGALQARHPGGSPAEAGLWALALGLDLDAARGLELARQAGSAILRMDLAPSSGDAADLASRRLLEGPERRPDDLRLGARLAARAGDVPLGLAALDAIPGPPTPDDLFARAEVLAAPGGDGLAALAVWEAAFAAEAPPFDLSDTPGSRGARRLAYAAACAAAGQPGRAWAAWDELRAGPVGDRALMALADIEAAAAAGPLAAADRRAARLEALLAAFPASPLRPQAEVALADARLAGARAARHQELHDKASQSPSAKDRYARVLTEHPDHPDAARAAVEAALSGEGADPAAARAALEALLVRPDAAPWAIGPLADRRAAADGGAATLAWLEALALRPEAPWGPAAAAELHRRQTPALSLAVDPARGPIARVRGHERLRLKLHRIDPEALLRAGGGPDDLAALDVGVIAPDREWTVELPPGEPGVEQVVPLSLRLPTKGYYALTAAGPLEEAQIVLRDGDAELLVRRVGAELIVGVLAGGRPDPGAPVRVAVDGGRVLELRADRGGVARAQIPAGPARVLSLGRGGPAMAEVLADAVPAARPPRFEADLDRPVALPGDRVGLRVAGWTESGPLEGRFSLWLRAAGQDGEPVSVEADRWGALALTLPVPDLPPAALHEEVLLMIDGPGLPAPVQLARLPVLPEAPPWARRLRRADDPDGAVHVEVQDADGLAVPGAPVFAAAGDGPWTPRRTDDRGALSLPPPPPGRGWRVQLPGGAALAPPRAPPAALSVGPVEGAAGAPTPVRVEGPPGPLGLRLLRLWEAPGQIEGITGPDDPAPLPHQPPVPARGLGLELIRPGESPAPWAGPTPEEGPLQPIFAEIGPGGQADLRLPPLPEGAYLLVATAPGAASALRRVQIGAGALRGLPAEAAPGAPLTVDPGGPALLTAEGPGGLVAALSAGGPAALSLPPGEGPTRVVAVRPGAEARAVDLSVARALDLQLQLDEVDGRWRLRARLLGPGGAPRAGQVALRAVDLRLLDEGYPRLLSSGLGLRGSTPPRAGGVGAGGALSTAAAAQPIAGALLAEAAREAAAARARQGLAGGYRPEALEGLISEEQLIMGSFGTVGAGSGGGASGYGRGGGRMGSGSAAAGAGVRRGLGPAHRAPALWQVVEVGDDGLVELWLDAPPPGTWRVEARAVGAGGAMAAASAERATGAGPRIVLPRLPPVGPHEAPRAALRVSLPSDVDPTVLSLNGSPLRLPPAGPSGRRPGWTEVELGPVEPGGGRRVELRGPAGPLAAAELRVPLAPPVEPDPAGELLELIVGPGGRAPTLQLARADAGAASLGAAARAGLGGLAALRADPKDADAAAFVRAQVHAVRIWLGSGPAPSAADGADALAFLAQSGAAGPSRPVTRGELEALAGPLADRAGSSADKARLSWALAVAGLPVDEAALGRLQREASALPPAARADLARALGALGRPDPARAALAGLPPAPTVMRARQELDLEPFPGDPAPWVPAPGHPERAAALEAFSAWAAARPAARGPAGPAELRVNGAVVATVDGSSGDTLTVRLPPGATVELVGAPRALLRRGRPLAADAAPAPVALRPRGPDGAPTPARPADARPGCGAAADPCRLRPGDALLLPQAAAPLPGAGGGLQPDGAGSFIAGAPGRYALTGLQVRAPTGELRPAAVWVEVDPSAPAPVPSPATALALARAEAAAGLDPRPTLAPWPLFDDWSPELRPAVMRLRWEALDLDPGGASPGARVAAFEALRDAAPDASLTLPEVAALAEAYRAAGAPGRSVDVWRAGLSAAFRAQVAGLQALDPLVGPMPGLRALQELPWAYPDLPATQELSFQLPERLAALLDGGLPEALVAEGVTPTDVRLLAAAWDRRFLALHPSSTWAPEAGLHLAQGLLRLGAADQAVEEARRAAVFAPDAPVADALAWVEGLARAELGDAAAARARFEALASREDWPQPGGGRGPAPLRDDACAALARLDEAAGRFSQATLGYEAVAAAFPEASDALRALTEPHLGAPEVLQAGLREPLNLPLTARNLDAVRLRAYPIDIRSVFLRDGGLTGAAGVRVDGLRPAWSGQDRLRAGPYSTDRELPLPLSGAGAWLVIADADGVQTRTLVVRSDLQLDAMDGQAGRRVVVRRGELPALGVELRALPPGGDAVAARTDLRGVAVVPAGSAVLAFVGAEVAFTRDPPAAGPRRPTPAPAAVDPMQNLDQRLMEQRQRSNRSFEDGLQETEGVQMEAL